MSRSRIGIAVFALAGIFALILWDGFRPGQGARPAPAASAATVPATQWSSRHVHWDLGTMADAAARSRNGLKGLPASEEARLRGELGRFTIVAHDRVKPTTRPGYSFFQDDEVPGLWIIRNDSPGGGDQLATTTTKSITARVLDPFDVTAEVTDPFAAPGSFRPDNIWEKRIVVHFQWELQDGKEIELGVFGGKGNLLNWDSTFVLPLPHADGSVRTRPATNPGL